MDKERRELALVSSYIMYHDLLEGTKLDGTYFHKIDTVLELAEEFIKKYPHDYAWEDVDSDWDETIEAFIISKIR